MFFWFFSGLLQILTFFFTRKFLSIAFQVVLIAAVIFIIANMIGGLIYMFFVKTSAFYVPIPQNVLMVWGWIMPPNAPFCILTVISAHIVKFFFDISYRLFMFKAKALSNAINR